MSGPPGIDFWAIWTSGSVVIVVLRFRAQWGGIAPSEKKTLNLYVNWMLIYSLPLFYTCSVMIIHN